MGIGTIVRPHGVRGALIVAAPGSARDALRPGVKVVFEMPRGGAEDFHTSIERASPHRAGAVIQVEGIADRDLAATYAGSRLTINRCDLPQPADREYYACDILGSSVYSPDGERLGTLVEIITTGANDVWVVRENARELLVPAVAHAIVAVDIAAHRVTVDAAAAQAVDPEGTAR